MSTTPPPTPDNGSGPSPWQQGPTIPTSPADAPQQPYGEQRPYGAQQTFGEQQAVGGQQPFGAPPFDGAPAPGTDLGADLGAALRWMWKAFSRNVAAFLVPSIVWSVVSFVIIGLFVGIGFAVFYSAVEGAAGSDETPPLGPILGAYAIMFASAPVAGLVGALWQSGTARGGRTVLEGERPSIGRAFIGSGRLVLTALLVLVLVGVGMVLLYIPGLIVAVMSFYALPAAARGARPVEALKESFALAKQNLGTTIIAYLILMAASSVASFLLVGIFVLIPLQILFQFGLHERLNHREPAEPVRA
ncbi:hypothetical protein DEO23_03260 [Brachybacterium endophyticum]|uniref:Glycerophosphoryl diester phosphodiesterase membrane domain-containing protein n=1 Tax=Brachybacterium endophyticum TaxID=2182385 RepID=A0A2U2RP74_9MICO|nr:hypothetical protein [Brachybacterium endophyticum]PWH07656.1 hypothetical protein DEO23_03260 [Brachybacterium endophyticum]